MKLASVTVAVAVAILGSGSATADTHCANGGRFSERLGDCIPRELCHNNGCGEPSSYTTCEVAPSGSRLCACVEGFENRQSDGNQQCHRIPGTEPPTVEPVPEPEGGGEAGEGTVQPEGGETGEQVVQPEGGETGGQEVQPEGGETGEQEVQPEGGETGEQESESESGETGESNSGSEESCNGDECEEEAEGTQNPEPEGQPEENAPEVEPSAPVLEKIEFMDQAILKVMARAAPSRMQVKISDCFNVAIDRAEKTVTVANASTSHSGRMAGEPSLTGGFVALIYHDGQNLAVIYDYQQETGEYGSVTVNVPFGSCGLDVVSIVAKSDDAGFDGLRAFVTADLKQRMSA
ncbi:hypothetical protein TGDOM2_287040 [Toxoplasma gondii GAB2-2007-GAL-DOM2]|uniref:Micronemal protein 1 galectin-like domain-containing protein n=6 Tax=Toxoplasma gondii TaxID=5811 RepID=B9QG92_TOXGV|nr:hypothetical protein TGVEG_287040 [Toxoplasma gondii VEG]KFG40209.1 hypothetical protein TGDOM2_287040 [Toxoplasma gondii GAB2-2007-GAL-DOM2]KFG44556.1 hypothetical protein TGP89_287040 [Toxoplasma gondii p89]KFH08479.1 hypothetical protein TGVAND_287040 [Toxoplasma gondii VAND]KYF43749.1 hypothetical protein TGARI_287040 [Toxoplasma gondii ARI]